MHNLREEEAYPSEIKKVLNRASEIRNNPTGFRKYFKGLQKDKIDVNDLRDAWKDTGYSVDLDDIKSILSGHGFNNREIDNIFVDVFGKASDKDTTKEPFSPATNKIAKIIIDNGLKDEFIEFMRDEFGFSEVTENINVEMNDIYRIFSRAILENRVDRNTIIQAHNREILGRNKK